MRRVSELATKLMPIAFVTVALVAVLQFWLQHGPSRGDMSTYATAWIV